MADENNEAEDIEDLDEDGSLLIKTNEGLSKTSTGDVFFLFPGEAES